MIIINKDIHFNLILDQSDKDWLLLLEANASNKSQCIFLSFHFDAFSSVSGEYEDNLIKINVAHPNVRSTIVHELVHAIQGEHNKIGFPFGRPSSKLRKFIRRLYSPEEWRFEDEAYALERAWYKDSKRVENFLLSQL